jgi:hypothetical protein
MHLIYVGHGAVALREVADAVHRRDVAVHRVESLEYDQLRPPRRLRRKQFFEMTDVVMAPNLLFHAGTPYALDHRIVVPGIRQDHTVWKQLGDSRDAGLVGHIARGEDQRRFLAVQVGEFALQLD